MTTQNIPAGARNTCISYIGAEYISFGSAAPGTAFKLPDGTDITAAVSDIDNSYFLASVNVVCDTMTYITDELGNAYFQVLFFTTTTQTRPNRA